MARAACRRGLAGVFFLDPTTMLMDDSRSLSRRRVLVSYGTLAALGALAGCVGGDNKDDETEDPELSGEGTPQMSAPTAPDTFADATELTCVAESGVRGGMGSGLFPFSAESDAEAFVADHGGQPLSFDDIDRQLVDSLQRG